MRLFFALAMLSASLAVAEEKPVEVPLKSIWAANMPGTRSIRDLEQRTQGDHRQFGPLMYPIQKRLLRGSKEWGSDQAGQGFAVKGSGIAALNATYDVFIDNFERPKVLPAGEVSLVFYARYSGQYCAIEKVTREGNIFTIEYRFTVHRTADMSAHLALIPVGTLDPGKYEVQMVQLKVKLPPGSGAEKMPPLDDERVKRVVSQPFSFEVK